MAVKVRIRLAGHGEPANGQTCSPSSSHPYWVAAPDGRPVMLTIA